VASLSQGNLGWLMACHLAAWLPLGSHRPPAWRPLAAAVLATPLACCAWPLDLFSCCLAQSLLTGALASSQLVQEAACLLLPGAWASSQGQQPGPAARAACPRWLLTPCSKQDS